MSAFYEWLFLTTGSFRSTIMYRISSFYGKSQHVTNENNHLQHKSRTLSRLFSGVMQTTEEMTRIFHRVGFYKKKTIN